ncbi:MAG: hypothetical protein PUD68_11735, partial [Clostridiales bacterium]|nr:hypothetical protein [Clostridiales bacterium]
AGGWSAGQSKSVAAFFVRIMTGVRFYWNVLRSIHACHAFLLECFSFDHACCLPPVRFFMAIPTGNEETRERGERSRRRGVGASLRDHIGFVMLSAGSTLGLRAPNLRQRAIGSLDSLHLIRGVGAFHAGRGLSV